MYQLVNAITCDITDQASPNSVCGFFMDFKETAHIYFLKDSNICVKQIILNGCIMHRTVLLLVIYSFSILHYDVDL